MKRLIWSHSFLAAPLRQVASTPTVTAKQQRQQQQQNETSTIPPASSTPVVRAHTTQSASQKRETDTTLQDGAEVLDERAEEKGAEEKGAEEKEAEEKEAESDRAENQGTNTPDIPPPPTTFSQRLVQSNPEKRRPLERKVCICMMYRLWACVGAWSLVLDTCSSDFFLVTLCLLRNFRFLWVVAMFN